jgi:hypothetical protein
MCAELLLIKGIVERLVERPRRGRSRRNCIWQSGPRNCSARKKEKGLLNGIGDESRSLLCESWRAQPRCASSVLSRAGGPADSSKADLTGLHLARITEFQFHGWGKSAASQGCSPKCRLRGRVCRGRTGEGHVGQTTAVLNCLRRQYAR